MVIKNNIEIEFLLQKLLHHFYIIKHSAADRRQKAAGLVRFYFLKGCLIDHFCATQNNGDMLAEFKLRKLMEPFMFEYVFSMRKMLNLRDFYCNFQYFGPLEIGNFSKANLQLPENVTVSHYFVLNDVEPHMRGFWLSAIKRDKLTVILLKSKINQFR